MKSLHSPVLGEFPTTMKIGRSVVGPGHACYIIGEAGSNHDRNLKTALQLVDAAAEAGCDAVKFQTFQAEDITTDFKAAETRLPAEFSRWGRTLREFYAQCAIPDRFHEPLAKRAKERGLHFLS